MAVEERLIESPELRANRLITKWIEDIAHASDTLRKYMEDVTRESKFMVDEFDSRVSAVSMELLPSVREPVVYEFLMVQAGAAATLILGVRRRISIPAGITSMPIKMRLYENDQRILIAGTPENPGAATTLYLEMTGYIYPHVHV